MVQKKKKVWFRHTPQRHFLLVARVAEYLLNIGVKKFIYHEYRSAYKKF
jgi:hypothetical protein